MLTSSWWGPELASHLTGDFCNVCSRRIPLQEGKHLWIMTFVSVAKACYTVGTPFGFVFFFFLRFLSAATFFSDKKQSIKKIISKIFSRLWVEP